MPSKNEYYWAFDDTTVYGDLWYLKSPQAAGSAGGGVLLLGSVLERVKVGGFMSFNHFPRPQLFLSQTRPIINAIINTLQLSAADAASLVKSLDVVNPIQVESTSVSADFSGQSGQIPGVSIPLNLGASLDLSKVDTLKMTIPVATLQYVPLQSLKDLFVACKGDALALQLGPGIDDQYLCDSVLVASSYTVTVTHHLDNKGDFNATIEAAKLDVKFAQTTDNNFSLTIDNKPFVIALSTRRWTELDPY